MVDDRTKRMQYFDRQFLRAKDFQDEQAYHIDRRRRHNRLLHTYGIAGEGLQVKASTAPGEEQMVLVSPGTAYDPQGQEIVLTVTPPETNRKVDLSAVGITPGPPVTYSSPLYLTIAYDEQPYEPSTDPGVNGITRMLEEPKLEASITLPTSTTTHRLLLAVIQRDASNGHITSIDTSPPGRLQAGALPPGSIGPVELKDGAVQSRHIALADPGTDQDPSADRGIKTGHLKDGGVTESKLADNAVSNRTIQDNAITVAKIANGSVTQPKVAPGSISLRELKATVASTNTVFIQAGGNTPVPPVPLPAGFYIANISARELILISWQEQWDTVFGPPPMGRSVSGRQWLVRNHDTDSGVTVDYKIYRIEES